jgi:hypothetical protein
LGPLRLLAHWLVSIACLLLHSHFFYLTTKFILDPIFFITTHYMLYSENKTGDLSVEIVVICHHWTERSTCSMSPFKLLEYTNTNDGRILNVIGLRAIFFFFLK